MVKIPKMTKSRMDKNPEKNKIPNGQNPEMGQNPE